MLKKHEVLSAVVDTGVVLIVRLDSPDEALAVSRAAVAGGIRALEITLSVPRALEVVRTLADEFGDHVAVGVGTVLDAEMAVSDSSRPAREPISCHSQVDCAVRSRAALARKAADWPSGGISRVAASPW